MISIKIDAKSISFGNYCWNNRTVRASERRQRRRQRRSLRHHNPRYHHFSIPSSMIFSQRQRRSEATTTKAFLGSVRQPTARRGCSLACSKSSLGGRGLDERRRSSFQSRQNPIRRNPRGNPGGPNFERPYLGQIAVTRAEN